LGVDERLWRAHSLADEPVKFSERGHEPRQSMDREQLRQWRMAVDQERRCQVLDDAQAIREPVRGTTSEVEDQPRVGDLHDHGIALQDNLSVETF